MAASHPEYAMPVYEMMTRLGVELGNAVVPQFGMKYAAAMRRCDNCPSKISCREWLNRAPPMVNFAPDFCANRDILFELRYDQPGPRHAANEDDSMMRTPSGVADFERLETEIETAIVGLIDQSADDPMIAELERRKLHLLDEIKRLRQQFDVSASSTVIH